MASKTFVSERLEQGRVIFLKIADLFGVVKNLTSHITRHTFATTVTLLNGVPIESVSKMFEYTNIKTTQHYTMILDIRVSEDMMALQKNIMV